MDFFKDIVKGILSDFGFWVFIISFLIEKIKNKNHQNGGHKGIA